VNTTINSAKTKSKTITIHRKEESFGGCVCCGTVVVMGGLVVIGGLGFAVVVGGGVVVVGGATTPGSPSYRAMLPSTLVSTTR